MEEEVYYVEAIVDRKYMLGKSYYYIKWQGYDSCDNTWEPAENLSRDLIEKFESKFLGNIKIKQENLLDEDLSSDESYIEAHEKKKKSKSTEQLTKKNDRPKEKKIKLSNQYEESKENGVKSNREKDEKDTKRKTEKNKNATKDGEALKQDSDSKKKKNVKPKLRLVKIIGFTDINEILHCVCEFNEGSIKAVPHKIFREKFPQALIDYYEENIEFLK